MATSVKEMLAAANAAVPRVSPDEAKAMIDAGGVLVVDVRDAPEVAASGKVKGALNVSRGMLGDLVERVFDGSAEAVMLSLFGVTELDEHELAGLRKLLNQKMREAKS